MKKETKIKCPNCSHPIDVSDVLFHQIEDQIKKDYEKRLSEQENSLKEQQKAIEAEKAKISETVEKGVQESLRIAKNDLERAIREKLKNENEDVLKSLHNELNEKTEKVKELHRSIAEVEKLKREKLELEEKYKADAQKEITFRLQEATVQIKKQAEDENLFKLRELEKQLADQKKLTEEMKRKQEQGSMQMQGEVQELELEKMLREAYIHDEFEEILKGRSGADLIQYVRTKTGQPCGTICYESKRTKNFDKNWLKKLKDDNIEVKADILVLVTETMPEGYDGYFLSKEGIWICPFREIKALSYVLRFALHEVQSVINVQHGMETKMELVYQFLTSQEFKIYFEAIIDGFKTLQEGYSKEKLQMQKIWKEREKQLEGILTNAVSFYGSLRGIAGSSIPEIKMLESETE